MGTPLYMSPEQAEGKQLDSRSDIYSFGVTCYQMLTGEPPFTGDTPISVAIQHIQAEPRQLETLRPDLSAGLCQMIHKMMAKNPAQRYQRPAELLSALRSLNLETSEVQWPEGFDEWNTPESSVAATSRMEATQRLDALMKGTLHDDTPPTRRRWKWIALVAATLLSFAVGAWAGVNLREGDLLAWSSSERRDAVGRRDSAELQFRYAREVNTERAYRSVWKYYPGQDYYVHAAKVHLAWLYLQPEFESLARALALFDELAGLDDESEVRFRAEGLAGQAVVYHLRGEYERSLARLADLEREQLFDGLRSQVARESHRVRELN